MALPSFARTTITVSRAPRISERGVEVRDWDNAETHTVSGCWIQLITTSANGVLAANRDARESYLVKGVLYAPPYSDILDGDRILYEDIEYLVEGSPYNVKSPSGRLNHMKVNVNDWEG